MLCVDIVYFFVEASNGVDWLDVIISGFIGLCLVIWWDWIKKPRIKVSGFECVEFESGTLCKLKFKVSGKIHPGASEIIVKWENGMVNAKWDENPNPLKGDDSNEFVPEKVPDTRTLRIYCGREYMIPIIYKDKDKDKDKDKENITVFSGWWFGRNMGYVQDVPDLKKNSSIEIKFISQNLSKSLGKFIIKDIIK